MENRIKQRRKLKVEVKLGTVRNTAQAADLFATMLRSVEMAKQRRAEENANGRTSTAKTPR